MVVEERRAGRRMDAEELLILNQLWLEREMTTTDGARIIQRPETDARAVLARLIEAGLVERRGRAYHLSAPTYQRLGDQAAYVRQRGFEPLQQEQMILQYVRKHSRITRGETAELCHLGPFQATRLLDRLVRERKLTRHGKLRGTYYTVRS